MNTQTEILLFDDFFVDSWDYVSDNVVSLEYYQANEALIREVTFSIYNIYKNTYKEIADGYVIQPLTPKLSGKLLEDIFNNIIKLGYVKSQS